MALVAVSPEVIDGSVAARLRFDDDAGTAGLRQNQRLTTPRYTWLHGA